MTAIAVSWPSIVTSGCALVFTVLGFWWMNWRPGKICVAPIKFLALGMGLEGNASENNSVVVSLPLIISNVGARPVVIEDMRIAPVLWNEDAGIGDLPPMPLEGLDDRLVREIGTPQVTRDYFAVPFVLKPNEVFRGNFSFGARQDGFRFVQKQYPLQVQYMRSDRPRWRILVELNLDLAAASSGQIHKLNTYVQPHRYPFESEPE